jgi:hypothetical protein
MIVCKSNPCDRCPPLPFIVQGEGHKGKYKRVTVLGSWHVPSYIAVRRGVSKLSCDTLSGKPLRGWVELFPPRRLASSPSGLGLS